MVRLKKEKGSSSKTPVVPTNSKKSKPSSSALRDQVLALGGDQADFELVQDVQEDDLSTNGAEIDDVSLACGYVDLRSEN